MYAEAHLHQMLKDHGVAEVMPGAASLRHHESATDEQRASAQEIVDSFDYEEIEATLSEINALKKSVTMEVLRAAVAGDRRKLPDTKRTAMQHIRWLVKREKKLRKALPGRKSFWQKLRG